MVYIYIYIYIYRQHETQLSSILRLLRPVVVERSYVCLDIHTLREPRKLIEYAGNAKKERQLRKGAVTTSLKVSLCLVFSFIPFLTIHYLVM